MKSILYLVCLALWLSLGHAQTTESPNECAQYQDDCGSCVKHSSCMWCLSKSDGKRCMDYPKGHVLPREEDCPLSDARWGVCWVNYKALLICAGVIGAILVLAICFCCVWCCCCRNKGKNKRKYERDMARDDRDREDRRIKSEERRAERQSKYDEIRKKYGIGTEGINKDDGYSRFENE